MSKFGKKKPNRCLNLDYPYMGAMINNARNCGINGTCVLDTKPGAYIITPLRASTMSSIGRN